MAVNIYNKDYFIEDDELSTDSLTFVNKNNVEKISIEKVDEGNYMLKIDYISGIGFTKEFARRQDINTYLINKLGFKIKEQ